jgi:hypothetical protein
MTLSLARRLLGLTATAVVGYGYGWYGRAYGITPLLVFTLTAACAWLAAYVWAAHQYADTTARANRERDQALAEVVSIREGRRYQPVPLEDVRRRKAMEKHPSAAAKRGQV